MIRLSSIVITKPSCILVFANEFIIITQPDPFNGTVLEEFSPTTVEELCTIITQGEIKIAFNDVLPKELMKSSIDFLLPYICSLINTSLATGSTEGTKESTIMLMLKKNGLDPEILKTLLSSFRYCLSR